MNMAQFRLKKIRIEKLFGLYNYTLEADDLFDDAMILYGDNGIGKSTILRLVFDLLSPSNNKGHRTSLSKGHFSYLEVQLSSGVKLTAENIVSETGRKVLKLVIFENEIEVAIWLHSESNSDVRKMKVGNDIVYMNALDSLESFEFEYIQGKVRKRKEKNNDKRHITGESIYIRKLQEVVPLTFILNADRMLDGDSISDADDEIEYRRIMHYGEPRSIRELVAKSREIALTQALNAASRWISRKAVLGTNQGADNVHSTYIRILKHIVSPKSEIAREINKEEIDELKRRVESLGDETARLAKYELATALDMTDFSRVLKTQRNSTSFLSIDLLTPSIYVIIDKFITIINELLTDKEIGFHLSQGFYIKNRFEEKLSASQLSSGEQQLLLLFCNVLVARDKPSLFIIDEPEISLNIKWQRKLIQYLLDITKDTSIQFMFASHSLEIISQHRSRVVKLVNENE